jgi:proteasome lid subunit RPN8/RPN11
MYENSPQSLPITWKAPASPFTIECSARVLDDIRLAVVDAFFSLPRGGAEIGGILLGSYEEETLRIADYAPLECEHKYGPSFTLSGCDEAQLEELLAEAPARFPGLETVGWYHSHTRSEIFLSDADLEIHRRFFPEPWQVALVMKPHTFQPTRAGFFFRERGGRIQASASYDEFVVGALPMHPAPAGGQSEPPMPEERPAAIRLTRNPEIGIPAEGAPVAPRAVEPHGREELPVPAEVPAPQFLTAPPSRSGRWVAVLLGLCTVGGAAVAGYRTQSLWLPKMTASLRPATAAPTPPRPSLELTAIDRDGQLQIHWDSNAPAVRRSQGAILEISEGGPNPQAIVLDAANLQNGFFTYARQGERVDVRLILRQPDGPEVREVTSFFGKLPMRKPQEDPEVRRQRDELAAEAERLRSELNAQAARTRRLERDLKTVRDELRNQQQRRLMNQLPEKK